MLFNRILTFLLFCCCYYCSCYCCSCSCLLLLLLLLIVVVVVAAAAAAAVAALLLLLLLLLTQEAAVLILILHNIYHFSSEAAVNRGNCGRGEVQKIPQDVEQVRKVPCQHLFIGMRQRDEHGVGRVETVRGQQVHTRQVGPALPDAAHGVARPRTGKANAVVGLQKKNTV